MSDETSALVEAQLVRRIAQGDRAALAALYDLYAKPLYSFAVRVVGDAKEAEDVLQEVFLQLWEKAGQFDEQDGRPFNWAVTMTRHKAIDRLRARQRRRRVLVETAESESLGEVAESSAPGPDSFGHDQAAQIRTAVQELPGEQRHAIELAFFGGLTHFEIAAQLREPLGTIKARIRRGILRLRDGLEGGV